MKRRWRVPTSLGIYLFSGEIFLSFAFYRFYIIYRQKVKEELNAILDSLEVPGVLNNLALSSVHLQRSAGWIEEMTSN